MIAEAFTRNETQAFLVGWFCGGMLVLMVVAIGDMINRTKP